MNKARGAVDPIAAEIGELGGLVRQIAETVAAMSRVAAAGRLAGAAVDRSCAEGRARRPMRALTLQRKRRRDGGAPLPRSDAARASST